MKVYPVFRKRVDAKDSNGIMLGVCSTESKALSLIERDLLVRTRMDRKDAAWWEWNYLSLELDR